MITELLTQDENFKNSGLILIDPMKEQIDLQNQHASTYEKWSEFDRSI